MRFRTILAGLATAAASSGAAAHAASMHPAAAAAGAIAGLVATASGGTVFALGMVAIGEGLGGIARRLGTTYP